MSYELLTSLYFGEGTNADLTSPTARALLHLRTPLEELIPQMLSSGVDVVLTGNPGDGKSHLARTLQESDRLVGAEVLLDLSARPTDEVLRTWLACRTAGRRFLLCGNQGPLVELIQKASNDASLSVVAAELEAQLRRLVVSDAAVLPARPRSAMLVDLSDRSVLDQRMIADALGRLCVEEMLPDMGDLSTESSSGRNLLMLQHPEIRSRLARLLGVAGRRCGEHVTFRQLWAAISCATTSAKTVAALQAELARDQVGLGTSPLNNLCSSRTSGLLVEAVRLFADPAAVSVPNLDEWLWSTGGHESDGWTADSLMLEEPPIRLWERGDRTGALQRQRELKRLVAIAHNRGDELVNAIERATTLPSMTRDDDLRSQALSGICRLFISSQEADAAPAWLGDGVPLWLAFTYEDIATNQCPHVAVRALPASEFEVRRPVRAPWLGEALGAPPEVAWLVHQPSSISLRIDPETLSLLRAAASTSGPLAVSEPIRRFLVRLAGWDEEATSSSHGDEPIAILDRPRGALLASGTVLKGGASYG
jgi:hypothetical protein